MSNIDSQITQQIVQFLATYGTPAGLAAAGAAGTGAVQALGSGATKAMKSLWGKVRHKSKQEGGIAAQAVTAFEADPQDTEHQQILSFVLKQLCSEDSTFANELAQLFNEVQRDPIAGQFIQHISGNAQVGIAGHNYGSVTIQQGTSSPQHQLQIELGIAYMEYRQPPYLDDVPTLTVNALNVGSIPSYVSRVEFESNVDGRIQVNSLLDFGKSQMLHKFGQAIQPGQKHTYFYHFKDFGELGTLGRKVIPVAVHVYDEIGNMYRAPYSEKTCKEMMKYFRS